MRTIKTLSTTIALLLCSIMVSAYDFSDYYDGRTLYFNIIDEVDKTAEVTYHSSYKNELTMMIPSKVYRWVSTGENYTQEVYSVVGISQEAFVDCFNLYSITLPSTITAIGKNAFSGCRKLNEVHISNLSAWCNIDFDGIYSNPLCQSQTVNLVLDGNIISDLVIPNDVEEIKSLAFHGYTNLKSVTFSSSVRTIGKEAFQSCKNLYSLTIPKTVTKIEWAAFALCENIRSIVVDPENVVYDSRENCNAIVETETNTLIVGCGKTIIPNTVTAIGPYAFAGSRSWDSGYFQGMHLTGSITIPESVTKIDEGAFFNCYELQSVTIGKNVKTIEEIAFGNTDIERVHISDLSAWCQIDFIGISSNPFYSNDAVLYLNGSIIRDLVIPNDIEEIKQYAFAYCVGLTSVVVHKKVKKIGSLAFAGCKSLSGGITCESMMPPTASDNIFSDIPQSTVLYVPEGSKNNYANAPGWQNFQNIVEYAVTPEQYIITYMLDGAEFYKDTLAVGDTIHQPEVPEKEGYTFNGWTDVPEIMPAKDVVVNGSYTINKYLIIFKIDNEVIVSDSLAYGSAIVVPEAPEKEGYTFDGWSNVPETMPAEDVTVTGSFSVNKYKLTYFVDAEEYYTDSVAYGSKLMAIEVPAKEGHTFSGWDSVPEMMPAKDVVVSGSYTVNKYLVTFKIGDEVIASDSLAYGSAIVAPEASEKEGHTFSGWGEVLQNVPAYDVTFVGSYTVNTYKVYYYVGDELVHTEEVAYGEAIPSYEYKPSNGDIFNGWDGEHYEAMPAHDVTYIANITSSISMLQVSDRNMVVYDLNGRRIYDLGALKSGLYIVNGKRVLVK